MPMWCSSSVWPSGAALATLPAPSVPPAPPTFSMITVWLFRPLRSTSAKSRATLSVGPPAANGTTMVTGLSGYWARATEAASVAARAMRVRFM